MVASLNQRVANVQALQLRVLRFAESAMPIYAYKCAECSHELDVIRKVSDAPLTDCPNCGRPALVKQITAAGFHLKGAGWYVTDFRDGGTGKKKDAEKPDEKARTDQASDSNTGTKADSKSDTGGDPKTATKTEQKAESKSESTSESKSESKSDSGGKPAPAPAGPPAPKSGTPGGTS